jgi:hypothetical protein
VSNRTKTAITLGSSTNQTKEKGWGFACTVIAGAMRAAGQRTSETAKVMKSSRMATFTLETMRWAKSKVMGFTHGRMETLTMGTGLTA